MDQGLLIEASCHGVCWEQDDETQVFNDSVLHSTAADLLIRSGGRLFDIRCLYAFVMLGYAGNG